MYDSCDGTGLDNVPGYCTHKSLVGPLGSSKEYADAPAHINLSPQALCDKVEHLFTKLGSTPIRPPSITRLVWRLTIIVCGLPVVNLRNMLYQPTHNWVLGGKTLLESRLKCSFESPQ